jgi:hypothetical protein
LENLEKEKFSFIILYILVILNNRMYLCNLDQEADLSTSPIMNKTVEALILNATKEANGTALSVSDLAKSNQDSVFHRRRRRGLGKRPNGDLDWWYGNWCGAYQGGYTKYPKPSCNYLCYQSTRYITPACRACLPPKDGFDEACMEHDR